MKSYRNCLHSNLLSYLILAYRLHPSSQQQAASSSLPFLVYYLRACLTCFTRLLVLSNQFSRERSNSLIQGQYQLSILVIAPQSAISRLSQVSQYNFLITSQNIGLFNFFRLNLLLSTSSYIIVSIYIRIRIQSTIITQLGQVLYQISFYLIQGEIKVRLIILSLLPLFYIGSPTSVVRVRFSPVVACNRCSACVSVAAYIPPYLGWWQLKSPRRITSPYAS